MKPRKPRGLLAAGTRLWEAVNEAYLLDDEPHKVAILEHACRTADDLARFEREMKGAPLTVKGHLDVDAVLDRSIRKVAGE